MDMDMKLEALRKILELNNQEYEQLKKYWKSAADVFLCTKHDLEYINECSACEKEKAEFAQELQDRSAAKLE
jgi:hypothetical protein